MIAAAEVGRQRLSRGWQPCRLGREVFSRIDLLSGYPEDKLRDTFLRGGVHIDIHFLTSVRPKSRHGVFLIPSSSWTIDFFMIVMVVSDFTPRRVLDHGDDFVDFAKVFL